MSTFALKELEDQQWFPESLRNYQTDFVGYASTLFNAYGQFAQYLKSHEHEQNVMLDLCAGSGAPAIAVFRECRNFRRLLLTDKFPNRFSSESDNVSYSGESADVLQMHFSPEVCYTMFNAFHHFSDDEKRVIVQRMQQAGCRA